MAKHRYVSESNIRTLISLIKQKFTDYMTDSEIEQAISDALASVTSLSFKKVDSLPETGESKYIYLVPNGSSEGNDLYNEYYWDETNSAFEFIGTASVDLSGYVKDADLEALTNDEITDIWASVMSDTPEE